MYLFLFFLERFEPSRLICLWSQSLKSPRLEDPDGALPRDLLYLQPGTGLGGDGALGKTGECGAEWGVSGAPGDRAQGTLCVFSRVVYPGQAGDSRTCGEGF